MLENLETNIFNNNPLNLKPSFYDFSMSFIYDTEKVSDVRLQRAITKLEKKINEFIENNEYSFNKSLSPNLNAYIAMIIEKITLNKKIEEEQELTEKEKKIHKAVNFLINGDFEKLVPKLGYKIIDFNNNYFFLEIENTDKSVDYDTVLSFSSSDIFNDMIFNGLGRYIEKTVAIKNTVDNNVTSSNFMQIINNIKDNELLDALYFLLNYTYSMMYMHTIWKNKDDKDAMNEITKVSEVYEKNVKLEKENETLTKKHEKEIKNLNEIIDTLKNQINDLKEKKTSEIEEELEFLKIENKNQLNQNIKLQEKYNLLFNKYRTIKKSVTENEDINKNEDINENMKLKEVDCDLHYMFVVIDNFNLENSIKKEFPNADFYKSTVDMNLDNIDMVIIITSHIKHTTYKYVKKQCKVQKVPMIQTTSINVDMIKNSILSYLNS